MIVYIPSTYTGPQDIDQLRTVWQGYIPQNMVAQLASLLLDRQSSFYTKQPDTLSTQLADCVDPSLPLNALSCPQPGGNPSSSSTSASSDVRKNAIIGVVSSLGGIALVIVGCVAYRTVKHRYSASHRRVSDPSGAGVRPEGQDFDRDSVGDRRRRSFYYAEDSLQGYESVRPEDDPRTEMRGRHPKHINPATISTPILQESTMNW